ncbi:MAG: TIGR04348 family glycosyltransferase [Betaproteobacteria bacterium]|nr:MAG: TIGR04348 family glycosyltransferase [Betaproteobacteria bacterium]
MRIALVTPARPGARSGNRHTALRWAAMLRAAGHVVMVAQQWQLDARTDLMLALHARRSHASMRAFHAAHPGRPLLLTLTGTDVYRDIRHSPEARASLAMAHGFIVLQPEALRELPRRLRAKASVVVQSSATRLRHAPPKRQFRFCVIGHLREEKDPLRAFAALALLPRELPLEVVQLGESLEARLARQARAAMHSEPRYRWLGGLPHARALRWLASSHAMVISSRMEGGANVVSEAIRIGVPVLASRIPGNIGLLGADYPAYFAVGNERALSRLMKRAVDDRGFYELLQRRVARLRPTVAPESEARMLLEAIARVIRRR